MGLGISCGHCGGRHNTVAQVRSCTGTRADTVDSLSQFPDPDPARPASGPAPGVDLAPNWEQLAGPEVLGRSVIVAAGATAPGPWVQAERIVVTNPSDPTDEILAQLQEAWSSRTRAIIEVHGDLPAAEPILDCDYWELTPDLSLAGERIRHLVLSNSIDARDPEAPRFLPVSNAIAAGAAIDNHSFDKHGQGDCLVHSIPAWCDGGPLAWFSPDQLGDVALIPAPHWHRGHLGFVRAGQPNADLAPDQLEAVSHLGGGARIIAPAGSGKTRVLTERVRYLVQQNGIDPAAICLVAFNVRAREEMQERLADVAGLDIRTLNSLALAIRRGTGPFRKPAGLRSPDVIDEPRVRRHLESLVKVRHQAMADPFAVWIEALTASRLGLRSPAEVERDFGGDVREFAVLAPKYRELLAGQGEVDFDDQILGAVEVLLTDPAARAAARRACQVLLVDEFQDLTPAHVLLVRLIAGPAAEVFAVGDDDQTIYGYSGASPSWLIDFTSLFPGASTHDLHINYRCPPEVVDGATNLLTRNRRRITKVISARPGREATPDAPGLISTVESDAPAALVAHVQHLLASGAAAREIAVLTRVNATLLAPMVALHEAGIGTNAPVDEAFLSRTGVAGALAWLRLATAPAKRLAAEDIDVAARRPPRGLSRRLVGWMSEQGDIGQLLALAGRMNNERDRGKIEAFVADLEALRAKADRNATTVDLLTAVRDDTGLGGALDNKLDASRRSVDRSAHGDDLAAMLSIAGHEPDPERFPDWLAERLRNARRDQTGVRLATVHKVKGREWPHVIVYEATRGLFPHRLATDVEEERRVFHVGVTRGSQSILVMSSTPASPFVAELSEPGEPPARPDPSLASKPKPAAATGRAPIAEPGSPAEASLREKLKSWRSVRAKVDAVPAYVVFNDATLAELAALRPSNRGELLAVSGIGPGRADRYGDHLLEIIAEMAGPPG